MTELKPIPFSHLIRREGLVKLPACPTSLSVLENVAHGPFVDTNSAGSRWWMSSTCRPLRKDCDGFLS